MWMDLEIYIIPTCTMGILRVNTAGNIDEVSVSFRYFIVFGHLPLQLPVLTALPAIFDSALVFALVVATVNSHTKTCTYHMYIALNLGTYSILSWSTRISETLSLIPSSLT